MFLQRRAVLASSNQDKLYSSDLFTTPSQIKNGLDLKNGGMIWVKDRLTAPLSTIVYDNIRGDDVYLRTDATAQNTSLNDSLSLEVDGFSAGSALSSYSNAVAWSFLKNVGFVDILTYRGNNQVTTIPHSLNSNVGLVIVKPYNGATGNWVVQHKDVNAISYLRINNSAGSSSNANVWNSTPADENNLYVGSNNIANRNGTDHIAYLFAHNPDKKIFCGSLIGNNNVDGPVANIGFTPKWILYKASSTNSNWAVFDGDRGFDKAIYLDETDAEQSVSVVEVNDLGFKIIADGGQFNAPGVNYIFVAIG